MGLSDACRPWGRLFQPLRPPVKRRQRTLRLEGEASDDGLASRVDVLRVLLQTFAAERLRSLATGEAVGVSDGVQTAITAAR